MQTWIYPLFIFIFISPFSPLFVLVCVFLLSSQSFFTIFFNSFLYYLINLFDVFNLFTLFRMHKELLNLNEYISTIHGTTIENILLNEYKFVLRISVSRNTSLLRTSSTKSNISTEAETNFTGISNSRSMSGTMTSEGFDFEEDTTDSIRCSANEKIILRVLVVVPPKYPSEPLVFQFLPQSTIAEESQQQVCTWRTPFF